MCNVINFYRSFSLTSKGSYFANAILFKVHDHLSRHVRLGKIRGSGLGVLYQGVLRPKRLTSVVYLMKL